MNSINECEFEILGYRFKFHPPREGEVDPREIVRLVKDEINLQYDNQPDLEATEASILVALKMASMKAVLEAEYKVNIDQVRNSAADAMALIEQVSPKIS